MLEEGKREQPPKLGFGSSFFLVVSSMIGAGVFTTSGFLAASLGNSGDLLWAWGLGGLLAGAGALCFAELGAMIPKAGAEYVYVREIFGRRAGFLCGFVSLVAGFAAPIAGVSLAIAKYAEALGWEGSPRLVAVLVVLLLTALHARGLGLGLVANNAATVLKIVLCLLFIGAGFAVEESASSAVTASAVSPGIMSSAFASALVLVAFAYTGWNAAAYLAGETKNPGKNLPRALLAACAFVTLLYLGLNLVFLRALSLSEMSGEVAVGYAAAVKLFGERAGAWFGVGFVAILVSTVSSFVLAGPRILWAMSEAGQLPKALAHKNGRGSPARALWLQAALASVMVAFAALDDLLTYVGMTLSLFAGMAVLGLMALRRRDPNRERPFRVPWYPLPPLVFLGLSAWMMAWSLKESWIPALASAGTLALGLSLEFVLRPQPPKT
ncbi:MAG: APC family permease [Planctomycetota bacterium]